MFLCLFFFLNNCCCYITTFIHFVFMLFGVAIFPDCIKIAKVIPIYNAGLKTELTNYTPISLLSNFSKILAKIIAIWILAFLNKHSIFCNCQFGFRKKHSAIHAVTDIITQCYKKLENKLHCCLMLLDRKKTFDSIDHLILFKKLSHYDIRGVANGLIKKVIYPTDFCISNSSMPNCPELNKIWHPPGFGLRSVLVYLINQ